MDKPILSIIIPTKNRYRYLKKLIELISSFSSTQLELIIQDNSTNNEEIKSFLTNYTSDKRIVYDYTPNPIDIISNCDLAVKNSKGEFVIMIGDDDGVTRHIVDCANWMKRNDIDSLSLNYVSYKWMGFQSKLNNGGGIMSYTKSKNRILKRDPMLELRNLLSIGASDMSKTPRLYYGIIKRKVLNDVYNATGSFFPGSSPDMANSVALCFYVKSFYFIDLPVVIDGASNESTAGAGARHQHVGEISEIAHLPKNTDENWDVSIPKFWSGPTIWAESAIKALQRTNNASYINIFNLNYLYAKLLVFNPQFIKRTYKYVNNWVMVIFYVLKLVGNRGVIYIKNRTFLGKIDKKVVHTNVEDIIDCVKILDIEIETFNFKDIEKMF